MLGNDIRRLGAVNLNLVTMSLVWPPIIYLSCTSSPAASHVWGPGVILSRAGEEKLFCIITSHKRVAVTGGQHGGEMSRRQLLSSPPPPPPPPSTQQERPPPLSSTPLAPLVRIVRKIAERLHEEVKVNLWIGKYSGQKPESMAWKLKEIVVAEAIFVVILKNVKGAWCHWLI